MYELGFGGDWSVFGLVVVGDVGVEDFGELLVWGDWVFVVDVGVRVGGYDFDVR